MQLLLVLLYTIFGVCFTVLTYSSAFALYCSCHLQDTLRLLNKYGNSTDHVDKTQNGPTIAKLMTGSFPDRLISKKGVVRREMKPF